jgi:hypothetical protein
MTQHFTTREFAQVLKQHGIDIYTMFTYAHKKSTDHLHFGVYCDYTFIDLVNDEIYDSHEFTNYFSAYHLTQVLGWLPNVTRIHGTNREILSEVHNGVALFGYGDIDEYNGSVKWYIDSLPIEALIIQGLTEGWLNKDNLNLAK